MRVGWNGAGRVELGIRWGLGLEREWVGVEAVSVCDRVIVPSYCCNTIAHFTLPRTNYHHNTPLTSQDSNVCTCGHRVTALLLFTLSTSIYIHTH